MGARFLKINIHYLAHQLEKEILTDGELLTFTRLFHFKMCLHRIIHIYIFILLSTERYKGTLPLYIGVCKQNMRVISGNKKVSVRCSVLRLCSKHRRVRELTTSARAQLACPNARATRVREW